jgi:hypothetical protein
VKGKKKGKRRALVRGGREFFFLCFFLFHFSAFLCSPSFFSFPFSPLIIDPKTPRTTSAQSPGVWKLVFGGGSVFERKERFWRKRRRR